MSGYFERLDCKECFSLAIDSAKRNQHGEAVAYLKRCIELDPTEARAHHFLGAEYAQIGMIDRAVETLTRAVELDPSLYTAVFQMGLLHLTSARVDDAILVWKGLDGLSEEDPLQLFRTGLEALARDEFDYCREALRRGIAVNSRNPTLNDDMQLVLDRLPPAGSEALDKDDLQDDHASRTEPAGNLFVSAYRNSAAG